MRFFFRYFLDDYGIGYPISLVLYVILLAIFAVCFVNLCGNKIASLLSKIILGSVLGGWILLGCILYSNLNPGNIPKYGTPNQKATLKRCVGKHEYSEITTKNITDIMLSCRTQKEDERLRNEIFR